MREVCAMTGVIFNPERPGQSIRELKAAGIEGVMFDFGIFAAPAGVLHDRAQEGKKLDLIRKAYEKAMGGFAEEGFMPSIARLPFTNTQTKEEYEEINAMTLKINRDCIKACEEAGVREIIVQPLFAGVESGEEWKVNREFYLALGERCGREDTKLLLTNLCRDVNGHLTRGVCSDGREAAAWIDGLNKEAGRERFGFCLDLGNCNLCGQDIRSMILALGERIRAVVLTENDGHTAARLLPFTSAHSRRSTMDWLGTVRGLRQIGFDGYLILETADTTISFSPLLQPYLVPVYKAVLDYFAMQINIERDLKKYAHVALFGAGNMCRNYMKCYGEKYPPLFTCDNNPKLWGTSFDGLEIKDPRELKSLPSDCGVIICNMFYREIEEQLRSMGIENIGYFNDEYMPSFYFDRLKREEGF